MTQRERLKLISISDVELTLIKQCLSDYLTAAGLIAYGKRDQLMAKRMQGDFIKLRAILDKAENKN